jgi:hypothetical protein
MKKLAAHRRRQAGHLIRRAARITTRTLIEMLRAKRRVPSNNPR